MWGIVVTEQELETLARDFFTWGSKETFDLREEIIHAFKSGYKRGFEEGKTQREILLILKLFADEISFNVKSCRAGDGDNRSWEDSAMESESKAEKMIELLEEALK